jgi:CheY-like chemotaxis protein
MFVGDRSMRPGVMVPAEPAPGEVRRALSCVNANDDGTGAPSKAPAGATGGRNKTGPGSIGRVLVVEDSVTVAAVVKFSLELEGFEVLMAQDGVLGLEMALRERPDVIVTDVMMPGMDGVAMVSALRADARTSTVRILMLTSESSVEGVKRALAAGADDYLLKPVETQRLAARVKALRARPPAEPD